MATAAASTRAPRSRAASSAATAPAAPRVRRSAAPAAAPAAPRVRRSAAPAAAPAAPRVRRSAAPAAAPAAPRVRRSAEETRANLLAKAHGQRRLSFGVLCIGIAGALLAGVVAVNVLVLRQNVELDRATRDRTILRAENATLASQVSAAVSASRIAGLAQRSLGLVQVDPEGTTYLHLGSGK